jgi:hypothetical protein
MGMNGLMLHYIRNICQYLNRFFEVFMTKAVFPTHPDIYNMCICKFVYTELYLLVQLFYMMYVCIYIYIKYKLAEAAFITKTLY